MSNERRDRQYLSGEDKQPAGHRHTESSARPACGCGRDHGGFSRRQVLGTAAAAVGASAFSLPAAADDDETFTIVHDLHSHSDIGSPGEPNIARYQTLVQEQIDGRDDVMFMGSGDELGSSLTSFFTDGKHKIEFMNDMNLTGVGIGNHDFDYGIDVAFENFENSNFPWITSNLKTPDGDQLPNTEEYIIEEVGDTRIGVFNVVLRGFHSITDYPDEYIQEDPIEVAEEMTAMLREEEGCDVVICASHVRHETHYEMAEAVDGLDAIFGSHSHVTFDEADEHHGTIISEIGYAYHHLGVMTLDSSGDLVDWQRIDLVDEDGEPADIEPDPDFKERIEALRAEVDDEVSQVVGETELELSASGAINYAEESTMGNLITNTMLDFYEEADVAFQNAGGIRTNDTYGPGELTMENILEINPFDNEIILFDATGEQIISALGATGVVDGDDADTRIEYLGNDAPFGAQQGQQVAGIQYEWSGHDGPEVHNVFIDGEPLDPDGTYTVATTDFIKNTASGYEAFHQIPDEDVIAESGTEYGPAVAAYIEERGTVRPELENRIIRVDEIVGAAIDVVEEGEQVVVTTPHPGDAAESLTDEFRIIARTGDELEASDVIDHGDEIEVHFNAEAFQSLAAIEEPHLRVFGGFDPDDDYYDYEDEDGEQRELPVAVAYDSFKLRSTIEQEDIDALLADDDDEETDDVDDDEETDDDDEGTDDVDDTADVDEDDDATEADDGTPGFGAAAGAAGIAGGAAYAAKRLSERSAEDDSSDA